MILRLCFALSLLLIPPISARVTIDTCVRHFTELTFAQPPVLPVEWLREARGFSRPGQNRLLRRILGLSVNANQSLAIANFLYGGDIYEMYWASTKRDALDRYEGHPWTDGVYESCPWGLVSLVRKLPTQAGESFVDIGSGFGTPALIFGLVNPEVKVLGLEIVPRKVDFARSRAMFWGLDRRVEFRVQDLSQPSFSLPDADYYFMYAPVNISVGRKLMLDLKRKAARKRFALIVRFEVSWNSPISPQRMKWLNLRWRDGETAVYDSVAF